MRIFLIVLDSFGIGELPDADRFGYVGAHTLRSCMTSPCFHTPNLQKLGLFNIDGIGCGTPEQHPLASFGKCAERSAGKDSTTGHWEIAGVPSDSPMPTFPEGFPPEVIRAFEKATGRKVLVNRPYSGTRVLEDYGDEMVRTGSLIVYTSADSVFQIAAHEDVVPVEELYEDCEIARAILKGPYSVGRVIARPFVGENGRYTRTFHRRDFSLPPPRDTLLNALQKAGKEVIGVGKIGDIFAGSGLTESHHTEGNEDGMRVTTSFLPREFDGLCFVNLVDFDTLYGHRNDVDGYARALSVFDEWLGTFLPQLRDDDHLILTADHGCDPGAPGTDHTREYIPLLWYRPGQTARDLGIRETYADIGTTIARLFSLPEDFPGTAL